MTSFNNFDTSSTGTHITGYAHYSIGLSQMLFDENIERLKDSRDIFFYNDCGSDDLDTVTFTVLGTFKEKLKFIKNKEWSSWSLTHSAIRKHGIDSVLEEVIKENTDSMLAAWLDDGFFNGYKLKVTPSKQVYIHTVRGYSQGDIATCLSFHDNGEYIQRLFYDTPISACVTVNSEEFYYELDSYDWQRKEWIADLSKQTGLQESVFDDLLPKNLEYV
jgi:hypothetical protein